jgi:hypothetical protein
MGGKNKLIAIRLDPERHVHCSKCAFLCGGGILTFFFLLLLQLRGEPGDGKEEKQKERGEEEGSEAAGRSRG